VNGLSQWQLVFDALVVAVAIIGGVAFSRQQRTLYVQREQLAAMRSDLAALSIGAVKLGEQFDLMTKRLQLASERQDTLELREPTEQSYGLAVRLARNGADIDELMASCGLVREEAELIVSVQHPRKSA